MSEQEKQYINLLNTLIQENNAHLRHQEIERFTLCAAATALIAGILAFSSSQTNLFIYLFGVVAVGIVYLMCERWNSVFDEHRVKLKECYEAIVILNGECKEQKDLIIKKLKNMDNFYSARAALVLFPDLQNYGFGYLFSTSAKSLFRLYYIVLEFILIYGISSSWLLLVVFAIFIYIILAHFNRKKNNSEFNKMKKESNKTKEELNIIKEELNAIKKKLNN